MPRAFTYDHSLLLKDAGAIAADAAAQVGGQNRILNLGAGRYDGVVIVDVTAIDVANADELYLLKYQVSTSPTFASGIVTVASLVLGALAVTGNSAHSGVGRYELPVHSEILGTIYPYARMFTDVGGTTPSINYTAFLGWLLRY